MDDSLEQFLKPKLKGKVIEVEGSMRCQECNEMTHHGLMSEDDMILVYKCSLGHTSKVKL